MIVDWLSLAQIGTVLAVMPIVLYEMMIFDTQMHDLVLKGHHKRSRSLERLLDTTFVVGVIGLIITLGGLIYLGVLWLTAR